MERRFDKVTGSLNALLVLEAAVRHSNFTRAGRELGLSQPTVSRHITTLEARLGRGLFERRNNQIAPTAAGRHLAGAVSLGLAQVDAAWNEVSLAAQPDDPVLACSFGFADNWLMPRFSGLKRALSGRQLRIATSDRMDSLDMDRVDIAVVWDLTHAPERPYVPLLHEQAFPVCSPDYLAAHPRIASSPEALLEADLLQFDVGTSGFLTWHLWFARFAIPYPHRVGGYQYNAYPFLLRAAQDGEGVALGWRSMVDRMLDEGSLVSAGPTVTNREVAYYLQYRSSGPHLEAIRTIIEWFDRTIADDENKGHVVAASGG